MVNLLMRLLRYHDQDVQKDIMEKEVQDGNLPNMINQYFFHEGGKHKDIYYCYSSAKTGKVKIVGPGYVPLHGDKATIINLKD